MTAKPNAPQCRKTTIVLPLAAVPESCEVEVNLQHKLREVFLYDEGNPMPSEVRALKEGDQVRIEGPAEQFPEGEVWEVDYIDLPGYCEMDSHFATLGLSFPGGCPQRYPKEQVDRMVSQSKAFAAAREQEESK